MVLDAVAVVARRAEATRHDALLRIARVLGSRFDDDRVAESAVRLGEAGRLTLNFHPDRTTALGGTVADGLQVSGRYLSQFATGTSSGSRSATAGGDRDRWENLLFDDVYAHADPATERPVYGAYDLLHDPHGGSPRFGSCFVVLRQHVIDRVTLCVGDSHSAPRDIGTAAQPLCILAGLYEQAAAGRLLDRQLDVRELERALTSGRSATTPARSLDGYLEAQVHGGVDLRSDVESIVLDPSFRGTAVEAQLSVAATRFDFRIAWHHGSEIRAAEVPADFRGPTMPVLARRVADHDGLVDAAAIGRYARSIPFTRPLPDGDASASELQQVKYLWHVVLALGHDRESRAEPGGASVIRR